MKTASGVDIRAIAEKLNVKHILRGSIRKSDEQLVANVQLIDAATGAHAWAEQYSSNVARMEETFHFKDPADLKHFTDGLRLAGFQ